MPPFESETRNFSQSWLTARNRRSYHRVSFSLLRAINETDVWKSLNGLKLTPKMREDDSDITKF